LIQKARSYDPGLHLVLQQFLQFRFVIFSFVHELIEVDESDLSHPPWLRK